MVTISIQEVRFEFARIKSGLERGEEFLLTYRNKPLAKLLPVVEPAFGAPDPALSFGLRPEEVEPMTNEEMDRMIYE